MKLNFLTCLILLSGHIVSAQLIITPGAQFSVFSDTKLTLQNTDLVNHGNLLLASTSPVSFTGDLSSFIGGNEAVRFFKLEINKSANQSVSLQKAISAGSSVFFSSGFLNLNGFDLDLETTGQLDGEREDSRVTGLNGGEVLFSTNLNSPTGSNPGNLGLSISSTQNFGNVIIKRGHRSQANNGAGSTILRYYDILPANNTNLNATLRFRYLDGELNGLDENSLQFLISQNNTTWTNFGFTTRDLVTNFVEKTDISNFGRFTLSNVNSPLPVRFIAFNARCDGNNILLTWKTGEEQNSSHFIIERSVDGTRFTAIGKVPAAVNSTTERSYSFSDKNPMQYGFYRIAKYDPDGHVQYTGVLRLSCTSPDVFSLWPNPVQNMAFINIVAGNESQVIIRLFDNKGTLVKMQNTSLVQGSNLVILDMTTLPNGIYHLSANWNNRQMQKTVQVVKQ